MPLIKRKPVELVPPPRKDQLDTESAVYYLKETGEIFPEYEDYVQRLSFYRQNIFQCELSGRVHLTFFEALKSERKQSALVHRQFPEALKGPILRSVQFYVTGRIDELVDLVYERFRDRFFEEETVVLDIHGDRFIAAVRGIHPSRALTKRREEEAALALQAEKLLQRNAKREDGAGEVNGTRESSSELSDEAEEKVEVKLELKDIAHVIGTDLNRDEADAQKEDHPIDDYLYSVQLLSADGEDDFSMARMERRADSLTRDRLSFSKTILKKYLKECVIRDPSIGSPWIVKPLLAEKFGIPTKATEDVEEKNRLIKEGKLSKRRKYLDEDGTSSAVGEDGKPVVKKARKSKAEEAKAEAERKEEEARRKEEERRKRMIKYPIEDLQLEPPAQDEGPDAKVEDDAQQRRSQRPVPQSSQLPTGSANFEPMMNSYLFLQACGKALLLSPFHLDDFEAALRHDTHDPPCHLIAEVHAALLNVIVRDVSNQKTPTLNTSTEAAGEEDEFDEEKNETSEEEDEVADDGEEAEEDEMDELDSKASSADESESDSDLDDDDDDEAGQDDAENKAEKRKGEEVYAAGRKLGRGWESKILKSDNFRAGWEYSLCGFLNKRSSPENFARGLAVLSHLTGVGNFAKVEDVKEEEDESKEQDTSNAAEKDLFQTPVHRYSSLSINDKILTLQFLCEQAVATRSIRRFFDQCEHQLTELRKERVELGRARRKLAEDRNAFEDSLKKDSDAEEGEGDENEESAEGEEDDGAEDEAQDEEDEEEEAQSAKAKTNGKHSKKSNGAKNGKRQSAKFDEDDFDGEDDELASTGLTPSEDDYDSSSMTDDRKYRRNFGSRQEAMRIKAIQREAEEAERLARLRQERAEQKARMQENRQIAVERKRLDDEESRIVKREEAIDREFRQHSQASRITPLGRDRFLDKYWWFDGVGAASLIGPHGQIQYSTGCLFVQGPSQEEWSALVEEYTAGEKALLERRAQEQSEEGVLGFDQWGVYTEPEEIDALMTWLRAKGIRELSLRQQLHRNRQYLQPGMQKRNHDLTGGWKDNVETRRSNRTKDSNAASRPPYMTYRNAFAKGV